MRLPVVAPKVDRMARAVSPSRSFLTLNAGAAVR